MYIKFRSDARRELESDGTWTYPFEGTLQFISGTGKYERIAGSVKYVGAATSAGSRWDADAEFTY